MTDTDCLYNQQANNKQQKKKKVLLAAKCVTKYCMPVMLFITTTKQCQQFPTANTIVSSHTPETHGDTQGYTETHVFITTTNIIISENVWKEE